VQVCDSEIPLPAGESDLSPDFIDFITLCMEKDPDDRPSASALLGSRWIQKHRTGAAELQSFVRSLYPDAEARMERDRLIAMKHSTVQ
jgi:serine/threonine protein kinase